MDWVRVPSTSFRRALLGTPCRTSEKVPKRWRARGCLAMMEIVCCARPRATTIPSRLVMMVLSCALATFLLKNDLVVFLMRLADTLVITGQTLYFYDVKTLNGAGWHYLNLAPFNAISAAEKKQEEVPNEYLAHINTLDEYTPQKRT